MIISLFVVPVYLPPLIHFVSHIHSIIFSSSAIFRLVLFRLHQFTKRMAAFMVANLKPGDGDQPIDIKVIRKWISFGKKSECCFIFIDKQGNAIQAGANLSDKNYFDSMIKVDTCYRLNNYLCEVGKTFMVTVPHTTGIRLGKAALFQTIPGDGFPSYYFNFLDHDHLSSRLDNNVILTDYIGKLEHVADVFRSKGSTLRRLKLENLSENMIDATFWDDAALSFNKEAVTSLPPPVIVAVTSMKVTQFLGSSLEMLLLRSCR